MSDVVKITAVRSESHDTKTFEFHSPMNAKAGQFVMVWIPGFDEIPMSLSSIGDTKSITVRAVGESTRLLHKLKEGDRMGVRGPHGNGFTTHKGEKMLIVAGGVGLAAVMPVIRETGADTVIGARTLADLIMEKEVRKHSRNVWISTDDGSTGFKGNAVQLMREKMSHKKYDLVIACGPEVMLYHVHRTCMDAGVKCQISLERFMKCGAGLCGSCVMDGMRICEDGPVFNGEQVEELKEMGRFKRDPSGNKVPF